MKTRSLVVAGLFAAVGIALLLSPAQTYPRKNGNKGTEKPTEITVRAGVPACKVDADGALLGATGSEGQLVVSGIAPGDHYIHVACPGHDEVSIFVSLTPGEKTALDLKAIRANSTAALSPLAAAEAKIVLRHMVRQAVQLRGSGQFDEAVSLLRKAVQLDPGNSDLHRELGITFLLSHDWERARIEMLEALHHNPTSADAHNDLGYALEKLGDLKAALAEYHQATRLDPDEVTYQQHYFEAMEKLAAKQQSAKKR